MKKDERVKASVQMFQEAAEVGSRFRQMREDHGLSQGEAAQELRISRERVANYEDGRTPLQIEVGLLACYRFVYSEKWLATGEGDPHMLKSLARETLPESLKTGMFYATAYKQYLAPIYEQLSASAFGGLRIPHLGEDARLDARVLKDFIDEWHRLLRPEKVEELMHYLVYVGEEFCAKNVHPDDLADPSFLTLGNTRVSAAFVSAAIRKAHARAVARKQKREAS